MINKKIVHSIIVTSLLGGLYGCGSSSSSTDTNTTAVVPPPVEKPYLRVVDGYVANAQVKDANNKIIGITNHDGKIDIDSLDILVYPLSAIGGYIDVNLNNIQDSGDIIIDNGVIFSADKGNIISPLTTLATRVDKTSLAKAMGLASINDLYVDPIATNNLELEKANQIAYAIIATNKVNTFSYNLNMAVNGSDLPNMVGNTQTNILNGSFAEFYQLAINSVSQTSAKDFINAIYSYTGDVNNIESAFVSTKKELIFQTNTVVVTDNTNTNTNTGATTNTTTSTSSNTTSTSSSSVSSTSVSNSQSVLPNFGDPTISNPIASSTPSDLPNMSNNTSQVSSVSSSISSSVSSVSNGSYLPSFSY